MRTFLLLALSALAPAAFAATPLTCGQPVNGSISANGTSTAYSFSGQAGDSILFRIIPVSTGVSFNGPVLQDPTGAVIKPRTTGLENFGFLTYDLATSGSYLYNISGTAAGNYMLVYVPLNRPCTAAGALTCGAPTKGTLTPGQMQTFQISGKNGDAILLRLLQNGGDPNASMAIIGFDSTSHLQVISQNRNLFESFSGISVVPYKLTSDGTQTYVVVESSGLLNMTFAINATDLSGPCGAASVSCGSAVDGSVGDVLVTPTYALSVNKGDIYLLRYVRTDTTGTLSSVVQVLDNQGNAVTPIATGDPAAVQYTFTAAGTYVIVVADNNGTGTGKYSFALARLNSPCNAQSITCGSTTNGQVSGAARFVTYSLSAQAGDLYLLRLLRTGAATSFKPRVQIYGPDGSGVQNVSTTSLGSITFQTSAAGIYTLLASDSYDATQTGTFTFTLSRLNAPCGGAVSLNCGTLAPGSIAQPLQAGIYSYPAAAGDSFTVRLVDTGGSLQTALQVYAPNTTGQALPVVAGNTKAVDVTGAVAGSYTILVTDQSSPPQTGTFAVDAISTRGACALSPPLAQSVSGIVSGPAPFTAYTFAVQQGEPLLLKLASFTPGFTANMDLYDPTGKRMGSSTIRLASAASATGNYTAVVGASSPRTAGGYAFAWQLLDQAAAAPLNCGQTSAGALGAGSQFSFYTLNANDGDLLKLVLTRLPSTTNAQLELFDPRGVSLKTSATEIDQKVSAGSYTVMVSPATANAETGGFALALQKPNNPCGAMNLTCGQTILQQVKAPGQLDTYTFSGTVGDAAAITVTPRTGAFSPVTELYDPSGNLVSGSGQVTTLNATLAATGNYTLTVHDRAGGNTGSYRVGLQHANTPCPEDDSQKPTITLVHPTGGEVIAGGTVYTIAWQSDDNVAVAQHVIQLSTDGGKTFAALPGGTASLNGVTQSYAWTVPAGIAPTRSAVIKVTATDKGGNTNAASSDLLTLIGSGFTANESVSYSYDPLNRIIQATYSGGPTIFYNYDGAGNLIRIVVQ